MQKTFISNELINIILSGYKLPLHGIHGLAHWARVMEYGLKLADRNGADPVVVALFAVFHDCRRLNEGRDNGHGRRGGDFASSLRGTMLGISSSQFDLLYYACSLHTEGKTEGDITVQTCWDSDRLDLNRVGITTDPKRLCTEAAKNPDLLSWAGEMSGKQIIPEIVDIWSVSLTTHPVQFCL